MRDGRNGAVTLSVAKSLSENFRALLSLTRLSSRLGKCITVMCFN